MYRMIFVDDEVWVVKSLRSLVKDHERFVEAGEARDGAGALALLREVKPHLAFVDIQMPGMNGLVLLEEAAKAELPTLFIIVSGYAEFAYVQKAMFHGAIGYCLKPFSKADLFACMDKAALLLDERRKAEARPPEEAARGAGKPQNRLIARMTGFVSENFRRNISVQDMADFCGVNPSYAGQLFRQHTGETFNTYLNRLRMQRAEKLLSATEMSIAEVARESGYRDYFYFAKVFRKYRGVTPSEYRDACDQKRGEVTACE